MGAHISRQYLLVSDAFHCIYSDVQVYLFMSHISYHPYNHVMAYLF